MYTIISGTNRPNSKTLIVARLYQRLLEERLKTEPHPLSREERGEEKGELLSQDEQGGEKGELLSQEEQGEEKGQGLSLEGQGGKKGQGLSWEDQGGKKGELLALEDQGGEKGQVLSLEGQGGKKGELLSREERGEEKGQPLSKEQQGGEKVHLLSLEGLNVLVRNRDFEEIEQKLLIPTQKFIFISPEYNGSIPGVLKAMFDISDIDRCWKGKEALLTGVSTGRAGNLRGMEHLTGILHYLKMRVHHNKLPISVVNTLLDAHGEIHDARTLDAIRLQLDEFLEL